MSIRIFLIGRVLFPIAALAAGEQPRVLLDAPSIDLSQAEAISNTLEAAAGVYVTEFKLDMPHEIHCQVTCKTGLQRKLWTDGQDQVFLHIASRQGLEPPRVSGAFNLYGMCHELGHMGMYRTLKDHDWLSGSALEGWAHFTGSEVVDRVWEQKGENLWWRPYDYRPEGSPRLDRQLRSPNPPDIAKAAGAWRNLERIIGRDGFGPVFKAWQDAKIDPYHPDGVLPALQKAHPGKEKELARWWEEASKVLLEPCEPSPFARETIEASKLKGKTLTLQADDNSPDGKWSYNDVGHGRSFAAPAGGPWYLKSVSIYSSRYGSANAPDKPFEVVLCDEQFRPISVTQGSYAAFGARGMAHWTRIAVSPVKVPENFGILVNFRTSASEGVYVYFDKSTQGKSVIGTPGKACKAFEEGDWMIRVELAQ